MKDWRRAVAARRLTRRRIELTVKGAAVGALIGAAVVAAGFYEGDQRLVEDCYTVKPGDTLMGIAEAYLPKNTGGRRYIMEFKQGIVELNPWLNRHEGELVPGQVLRINYWVKEEKAQ